MGRFGPKSTGTASEVGLLVACEGLFGFLRNRASGPQLSWVVWSAGAHHVAISTITSLRRRKGRVQGGL